METVNITPIYKDTCMGLWMTPAITIQSWLFLFLEKIVSVQLTCYLVNENKFISP